MAIGTKALKVARLLTAMRGKIVLVRYGKGVAVAVGGPRMWLRGTWCDAAVALLCEKPPNLDDEPGVSYQSYPLKRLPPFSITRLSYVKLWALALVHEAEHVRQHHAGKGYSELKAERAVLKAQKALSWGRLWI
jgi:hypothetical protein